MKLGIVYHMPFWQTPDGRLVEIEGSFARYVDSLAPYFDEISICAPSIAATPAGGTRVRSGNVRLAALPPFDGPRQFYPRLPSYWTAVSHWVSSVDALHCRVPTPAAFSAFVAARRRGIPIFLLVVGDLRALLPTLPYRGLKRLVYAAYTAFEEWTLMWMTRRALTFANGAALADKHRRGGSEVVETKTTTIAATDIASRSDTCIGSTLRLLTVSRIDPRKGLRCLPEAVAALVREGIDARLDLVGPTVGAPGAAEREAIGREAERLNVADRVRLLGPVPLERLMARYGEYDVFVLPTRPGEGIPRVLLEAMAAGLPIVVTRVAGIPSLVRHGENGYLIETPTADAVSAAITTLVRDPALRRRIIQGGYETARAHTLEAQAASMMAIVGSRLGLPATSCLRAS
jgi:glycosyltransferase involved in cell wall biosynthesis